MENYKPTPGPLLADINTPDDLKKLKPEQLQQVCDELREFIIDMVSVHGGHFGASLGVIELTVALHYTFNTPKDQLLWDVGHQAYGHKILTGRREEFHTNRKYKGLSGFPKRTESEYDAFGVGHSSTSISAGLGMAVARDLSNSDKKIVSVIGDGAMTGGMAFEAMNNAGALKSDMLVVLNDNNMSIDPNVGALKEYLAEITTTKTFNKMRDEIYDLLGHLKGAGEKMRKAASKLERAVTAAITPGALFQALGFKYYGPVDGHNVDALRRHLEDLRTVSGPKILHIVTVKGKGFSPAEREQTKWHAQSSPFDKITGKSLSPAGNGKKPAPKYQDVFGEALVELAADNENIVGITPAMPSGSSLWPMMNTYPDRAFDVGIAEQHAVTFAAGLAAEGKVPFAALYSTFLQRGYDQVIHDVAIQNLPVVFCIDRAGLVGADGPTHHGLYDVSYLRSVPNMIVSSPLNEQDLRDMLYTASKKGSPWAIRYPRGRSTGMEVRKEFRSIEIGKGQRLRDGDDIAILSFGPIGKYATEAIERLSAEGVEVGHFDMRFAKPLDTELIDQVLMNYNSIITLEDGTRLGGLGSAVAEYVAETGNGVSVKIMGVPDRIVEHGTQRELHDEVGIGPDGIVEEVRERLKILVE